MWRRASVLIIGCLSLTAGELKGASPLSVCELWTHLGDYEGRTVEVRGRIFGGRDFLALGAGNCPQTPNYQLSFPIAIRLLGPEHGGLAKLQGLAGEALTQGNHVEADATIKGVLRVRRDFHVNAPGLIAADQAEMFPAELVVDEVQDASIEAEPAAEDLPVLTACEVFRNLPGHQGKRIAVSGIEAHDGNGRSLCGECSKPLTIGGMEFAACIYIEESEWRLARYLGLTKRSDALTQSAWAQVEEEIRARRDISKRVTYVGRIEAPGEYSVLKAPEPRLANGYGLRAQAPARLHYEAVRSVEIVNADSRQDRRDTTGGFELPAAPANPEAAEECRNTDLMQASEIGCLERVRDLLDAGADPNSRDEKGATPLHQAILNKHEDLVRILVAAGADVRSSTDPLCSASMAGLALVRFLLDAGAPVNPVGGAGCTPLGVAAEFADTAVLDALLAAGADLESPDAGGRTPLLRALGRRRIDNAKRLIAAGANVNTKENIGWTPILYGTRVPELVPLLISVGAEVNMQEPSRRTTALMWACLESKADVARALLAAGADPHSKDRDGNNALMYAVKGGYADCIPLLLAAGIDADAKNNAGKTALDLVHGSSATYLREALQRKEGTGPMP